MKRLSELLPRRKTDQPPAGATHEDYVAHMYLGNMYLKLGQDSQAEAEYSRAYALFPSEECKQQLSVVKKRRGEQGFSSKSGNSSLRVA
jgi:hypothetical protein